MAPIPWPIYLLPISGKIFERLIFNKMFEFFIVKDLIPTNQSSFKRWNSGINQLLSITHLLTMDSKLEEPFLIYQKPLIKVGMRGYSINLNKIVSQVMF